MRKLILAAAAAALVLCGGACKRRDNIRVAQTEEETPQLATMVHVADPSTTTQLVSGFYGVEQNAWRWTAGHFSVVLRPPHSAAQKGATLQLKLTIPEPVIQRLKTMSLSASIAGTTLPAESYTHAGEYTYTRDVPPALLAADAVHVDFALDKAIPPSDSDRRELGLVVSAVGFESK